MGAKTSQLILIASIALSACSSARLRYTTEIDLPDGSQASYQFEKSYSVRSDAVACGITGIIYGGWCWMYLGMPRASQKEALRKDAFDYLKNNLGKKDFTVRHEDTTRVSWDAGTDRQVFAQTRGPSAETSAEVAVNAPPSACTNDLKDPLSIVSYDVETLEKVILEKARLRLTLKNSGNKRISSFELRVRLSTKLNGYIGTVLLEDEAASIEPCTQTDAYFEFTENIWVKGSTGKRLSGVSSENLEAKLVSQRVVKK